HQSGHPRGQPGRQRPGQQPPAATSGQLAHRGFRIDASAIASSPRSYEILASLARQTDTVVGPGRPAESGQFFPSQRTLVRPERRSSGRLKPREGGVAMAAAAADAEKASLLHYMVHAYHWHVMPGGYRNQQIDAFYARAREGGMYPQNSPVLKSAP